MLTSIRYSGSPLLDKKDQIFSVRYSGSDCSYLKLFA